MLMTPLINPIARWVCGDDEIEQDSFKSTIQLSLVVLMLIGSVILKAFREEFCNNFVAHPFED
jgi:hypothetical protein